MKDNKKNIEEYLLILYFDGNCTNEEKSTVESWLNEDKQNREYFNKLRNIWAKSRQAKKYGEIDIESSLKNVKSRINIYKQAKTKYHQLWLIAKVAAVVLLFVGIYAAIEQFGSSTNELQYVVIETNGPRKEIQLPDSSVVFLNSNSKLEYPKKFEGKTRTLKFEGEAYFEVKPDKAKPFIIETNNACTQVLGTAFNLRAIPGDTFESVVVTEGKVQFTQKLNQNKNESVELIPGEKAVINIEQSNIKKMLNKDKNFMAWQTGILIFENTPLNKAVLILSEHYNMKFNIENDKLSKLTINAEYDNFSVEELIEVLKLTLNVKIEKENGVINIY